MKKNLGYLTGLISLLLIVGSCKSVAILPTSKPVKNVDIVALAAKIKSNYPSVSRLRSRIKATYDNSEREQQIIIQLRMEAQQKLWMSASMIIPIAKLMITPNKVSFYEKFQKNYFQGTFDLINSPFKTDFDFKDIENLFLGKPFVDPAVGKWKQISNPIHYVLIPTGKRSGLLPTLFFDPVSFLLKEQRLLIPGTTQTLSIKYLNHMRIEGENLPQRIEVSLFDGEKLQRLELEYTRTDLPSSLTFPFEIPEGYKKISF
jgi:hypothetical protein